MDDDDGELDELSFDLSIWDLDEMYFDLAASGFLL